MISAVVYSTLPRLDFLVVRLSIGRRHFCFVALLRLLLLLLLLLAILQLMLMVCCCCGCCCCRYCHSY
jgi:hypothetical protein